MVFEMQLLLHINLEKVIKKEKNIFSKHSSVRKMIHKWKAFKTVDMAESSTSDMLRELKPYIH